MENENKKSGWKIFFYLTPLYIILGYPIYNWHQKVNSGDVNISKEDYSAFASDEGEIKQSAVSKSYEPEFQDVGYSVNYRSDGESDDTRISRQTSDRKKVQSRENAKNRKQKTARTRSQIRDKGKESIRDRETKYIGKKKGFLTSAVGKAMKNPKVVKALFNNGLIVNGFMGRDKVKEVLQNPDALADYIKNTPAASNFLNNAVVKKALNNPAVMGAIASSKLINTLMATPAVKGLLNDEQKVSDILAANPELMPLLSNPAIMGALMQNPDAANALSNLNK
ncbi:MAG: hypothetical protein U9Q34_07290 [Elusimicrobiota bacterium]|nr:hypothetical protein [Elusimicrobiota bacterium]